MGAQTGGLASFLPLIIMLAIFYVLLIRPNQKREKAIKAMRDSLKPGDQVMTIGGIGGKIVAIEGDKVILELEPDKIKIAVERWGVGRKAETPESPDAELAVEEADLEAEALELNELENENKSENEE